MIVLVVCHQSSPGSTWCSSGRATGTIDSNTGGSKGEHDRRRPDEDCMEVSEQA